MPEAGVPVVLWNKAHHTGIPYVLFTFMVMLSAEALTLSWRSAVKRLMMADGKYCSHFVPLVGEWLVPNPEANRSAASPPSLLGCTS